MINGLSRRFFLATSGITAACATVSRAAVRENLVAPLRITALLVGGVENPLGVHDTRSRLSWQLIATSEGVRQLAYRIGVASSHEKAAAGMFDFWDSGKIESSRCFDIAYEGKSLSSRQRAWWIVTAWTEDGASISSDVAYWEMGLLRPDDWVGKWIAAEDDCARADRTAGFFWLAAPEDRTPGPRSFRLSFDLSESAAVALFVSVNAVAELRLDGKPISLPPHNPNAWGAPQPVMLGMALPAGPHTAIVTVSAQPQADAPNPKAAFLVRATLADGRVIYFDDRKAETMAAAPANGTALSGEKDPWESAQVVPGEPAPLPSGSAYLLRRSFELRGVVVSARLYVTALGVYEAEINGERVGDALLTPEFTDYHKRALYAVHDVAALLQQGSNVLGGTVGEGWYGSNVAPGGRYSFGPAPLRYMAQLEIVYADGRLQVICGDDQWMIARAPITASGIYDGEDYDARLELPQWSTPGFSAAAPRWQKAAFAPDPAATCRLVGSVAPPIRRVMRLTPKSVRQVSPNRYVADFGQNFAGWVRLRARGAPGTRVILRFAELANDDGSVDQSNLRGARAADTYIMRGDATSESYEPRFTYHGFRYVEVEGLDAPLRAQAIDGIVIHSDLAETGQVTVDSYIPQRMWQNALWSQRSNFVGIPTDCPQRDERLGWMGDAHVFWDAAAYNMDVGAFTRRFMGDVEDAQRADGGYPDIAPDASGGTFTSAGSSPGWADAGVILPWTAWWRYGDTGIVDANWASMERFMDSIRLDNPELIWSRERGNDYADWLALDAKQPGDPTTPKDLVGTAMWKAAADAMADMAAATGRTDRAKSYRSLAEGLTQAFARKFVRPDGTVGNGSQTGYIQALHFGLLPTSLRPPAGQHLVRDIIRRGTLLSTGFLGTPYSLDVLAAAGEDKLLFDLLLRDQFPSWGYMIAKNATTIWERWNGDTGDKTMNSFNHYALGAVAGFLYRRVAGIDATAPGFASFRFDPVYDPRLNSGSGRYASRSGLITTRWEKLAGGDFHLQLQVPSNTEATVILPTRKAANVRQAGQTLAADRVSKEQARAGKLSLRLLPGKYDFQITQADFS